MILSDRQIIDTINSNTLAIEPFDQKQVQPASYDLRVGEVGISTSSKEVVDIKRKGFFELNPGDFAIILTRELLRFDAWHSARIGLRSGYGRKGIIATAGPQIDPGFEGRLKIGLTNLSPHKIVLPFEDYFITIEIHKLSEAVKNPYSGPYQGDEKLSASDVAAVTEGENMGFASILDSMRSLSANVGQLTEDVKKYTSQNDIIKIQNRNLMWIFGVGIAFIGIMIAFIGLMRAYPVDADTRHI